MRLSDQSCCRAQITRRIPDRIGSEPSSVTKAPSCNIVTDKALKPSSLHRPIAGHSGCGHAGGTGHPTRTRWTMGECESPTSGRAWECRRRRILRHNARLPFPGQTGFRVRGTVLTPRHRCGCRAGGNGNNHPPRHRSRSRPHRESGPTCATISSGNRRQPCAR